jgi:hypothetical protein
MTSTEWISVKGMTGKCSARGGAIGFVWLVVILRWDRPSRIIVLRAIPSVWHTPDFQSLAEPQKEWVAHYSRLDDARPKAQLCMDTEPDSAFLVPPYHTLLSLYLPAHPESILR